jgi:hypothetical protein
MYFEDDEDLIALLDDTVPTAPLPELIKIYDGVAGCPILTQLLNRYSADSPFREHGLRAGHWFETTEDDYLYFLNCMPPLCMTRDFFVMCECVADNLYNAFFKIDDRFFCLMISWQGPQALDSLGRLLIAEVRS